MLGFAFKDISFFYNTFVSIAFYITSSLRTVVGLGGFLPQRYLNVCPKIYVTLYLWPHKSIVCTYQPSNLPNATTI